MKKRLFTLALAGALTVSSLAALAAEIENEDALHPMLVSTETGKEEAAAIGSYIASVGKITDITEDQITIMNENEEIILNTAFVQLTLTNDGKATTLKKGDEITAYVHINMPTLLMLPVHYSPSVIIVNTEKEMSVDVDTYVSGEDMKDASYVNTLGNLVVNLSDETELLASDGSAFEGDVNGRDAVVFYNFTTRSIPAQTSPNKVYILDPLDLGADADEDTSEIADENTIDETAKIDLTSVKTINANGKELVCAPENGLLPLREISEALGLTVKWDNGLKAVTIGNAYVLYIGQNSYIKGKMMPIELSAAPELIVKGNTGVTYVPFEYFTEVLGAVATQNGSAVELTLEAMAE